MIEVITGLPGAAKTLHMIHLVKAKAERENRPVYYSGIKSCLIEGWTEIDPLKWYECPSGSIILIDESQKIFRARTMGSVPPMHVTELEEHRHKGIDLFFGTQHPALIDPAVRKLTQTHRHLIRIFGMEVSTVHKWNGIKENPDRSSSRLDSEKTKWAFDKSLYGQYHSADEHTMKRVIPFRVKMLFVLPFVLIACGYFVYSTLVKPKVSTMEAVTAASSLAVPPPSPGGLVHDQRKRTFDAKEDAKLYVQMQTPRVVGLPQTAPKYDELTKPTRVPVPAICIAYSNRCKCFSQQATPMGVPDDMCKNFAEHGYFQEFDPNGAGGRGDRQLLAVDARSR